MLFSICIPSYNRANTVLNAIKSLQNQTLQDYEILLVDDGSTDNTRQLVSDLKNEKLTYLYKKNGGKHTALNMALDNARGELFLVLDSDDQLVPDALERMSDIWSRHKNEEKCCGIMGRCRTDNGLIGKPFDKGQDTITYIGFHFGKNGEKYKDCCECIRTEIINKHRWPEDPNTHFIPEALVMDKIGLEHYLVCVNDIFKEVEYLAGGITNSGNIHKVKNKVGYLYYYVSTIDNVFPTSHSVCFKKKVAIWWNYWRFVELDTENLGPRVKKVSILGRFIHLITPLLNTVKKG